MLPAPQDMGTWVKDDSSPPKYYTTHDADADLSVGLITTEYVLC